MENSDVFASSTAPVTLHDFLERMRHPSAADFVKAIKSFIVSFLNKAPDAERDSAALQEFLGNMEAAFRAHSLWAGSSEEDLESAAEGLEKYVMTKLYTRVFASIPEDVNVDEQLHEKMALLQQFIRPENLDIKPTYQNETSWLLAQKELQKINMYKAPRDKLVCILDCCKVISNLLLNASLASNEDHPGADEFLPVLIYVTIKANPPQLHSNLSYIQRFRRQTRLSGEAAYFFTNMLSVESFITNIDGKALSMDETEFEKNMESAQQLLFSLSESSDSQSQSEPKPPLDSKRNQRSATPSLVSVESSSEMKSRTEEIYRKDESSLNKIPSISDLENKGASMLLKEDEVNHVFKDFPFLYSQTGDLTIGDVEDLLSNYKQLVFKYVCLAKGLGANSSPLLPNAQGQNLEQTESKQPEVSKELPIAQGQNLEQTEFKQPEISAESEKTGEAHRDDNDQNDPDRVANDSGEISVFGSENSEPKMPEEATDDSKGGEEGKEDPQKTNTNV